MIYKILAGIIVFGLLLYFIGDWTYVAVGVVLLLFIIRLVADAYWWGKDKNKW